jgi:hypothetical protein
LLPSVVCSYFWLILGVVLLLLFDGVLEIGMVVLGMLIAVALPVALGLYCDPVLVVST